ncbi:TnsA-like heteromeric transposase endonuclease subunit [Kitasatospora aburaviensis]
MAGVSVGLLRSAVPWRTFRWYMGQRHYSGTYWSATMRDHVIYESRLELARLVFADFDPSVQHIVAQPFLLKTVVDGEVRKHIPDYLLITEQGPVVVDVKPRHRLARSEVAFTFEWTRRVVESRGGASRSGASRRRRGWRTSASWPVTAGTGCSAPRCWTSSADWIWTESR